MVPLDGGENGRKQRWVFNELTIKNGPNSMEVTWLNFKLDSARIELTGGSPGGRRPGRGATAVLEEACNSWVARSSTEVVHALTCVDRTSQGVLMVGLS